VSPSIREFRPVAWIWIGLSLVLVVLLVAFAIVSFSIERKWQAMEALLDKLLSENRARIHTRIVPGGPGGKAIPGNAWDEYTIAEQQADALVSGTMLSDYINDFYLNAGVPQYRPEFRNLLAQNEEALDHLHRGAQRSNGQYPYKWERPESIVEVGGYMHRMQALDNAAFPDAQKEFSRINAEAKATTNPMTTALFPFANRYAPQHRFTRLQLRLLQSAATYRAAGKVPESDDFGDKLFHKEGNGKMKIWGAGLNGKNDGGTGDDMVIEIPISK
jgi:hypothetical protein